MGGSSEWVASVGPQGSKPSKGLPKFILLNFWYQNYFRYFDLFMIASVTLTNRECNSSSRFELNFQGKLEIQIQRKIHNWKSKENSKFELRIILQHSTLKELSNIEARRTIPNHSLKAFPNIELQM